jgi:hypothetical protein
MMIIRWRDDFHHDDFLHPKQVEIASVTGLQYARRDQKRNCIKPSKGLA